MFGLRVLLLGVFVRCLQVEEQVRLDDPRENLQEPSNEFLRYLRAGRSTLVIGESDLPDEISAYLKKRKHEVSFAATAESLVENGAYTYDSVILNNAVNLTKAHTNRIAKFYDTRWIVPLSYDSRYRAAMKGLNLPPTIIVLGRVNPSLAEEFGLSVSEESNRPSTYASDYAVNATNSAIRFAPAYESPFLRPVATFDGGKWGGCFVQGDISMSRALFLGDLTNVEAQLEWAFHRKKVRTWSNLQHHKISAGREFDEFTGKPLRSNYSITDLAAVETTHEAMYKIRDEILASVDVHALQESSGEWTWAKGPKESRRLTGAFEMMIPYWRKRLTTYGESDHPTAFLRACNMFGNTLGWVPDVSIITHFKAPRQHGIYKFIIRPEELTEWSPLWIETLIPIRTYLHDEENPSKIWSALPFYFSMLVMIVGPAAILAQGRKPF